MAFLVYVSLHSSRIQKLGTASIDTCLQACTDADPYEMPELTAADFQRRASREAKRASGDKRRSSAGSRQERCAAAHHFSNQQLHNRLDSHSARALRALVYLLLAHTWHPMWY